MQKTKYRPRPAMFANQKEDQCGEKMRMAGWWQDIGQEECKKCEALGPVQEPLTSFKQTKGII